jgi:xanthine/uracil permease
MDRRVRRGVSLTGVMNIVSGGLGIIGPVNFSLSPGVVAGSRCASRYTIIPTAILLIICGFIPQVIALFAAIPDTIIGVILLYLMGTQLAAAFHIMVAERNVLTFNDGLISGLPVMMALLFAIIPAEVVPQILRPIIQNGFVMGVITVILMEHIFLKEKKLQ